MSHKRRALSLFLSIVMMLEVFPSRTVAASGSLPFRDVASNDWFYDGVKYCYDNGLMNGTSNTTFEPGITTTRAMVVAILHRQEGSPAVTSTGSFTDVRAGTYYAVAVEWASKNGIVNGYGSGIFGPNNAITREQMAAILYRYATYKNYDVSKQNNIRRYIDYASINSWALEPLAWANAEGLINGTSTTTLSPKGNATRAQVAVILSRFCQDYVARQNVIIPVTPSEDNTDIVLTPTTLKVTVSFDLNYSTNDTIEPITVQYGEKVSKPTNPSRKGYIFGGWSTSKNGGLLYDFNKAVTSNITLYARWSHEDDSSSGIPITPTTPSVPVTPSTYTVTFYMNDGTEAVYRTSSVTSGSSVSTPAAPSRDGYTFSGWYTDTATVTVYNFSNAVTQSLSLYAKWEIVPPTMFTVTFYMNDGTDAVYTTLPVASGDTVSRPTAPTRDKYTFGGWYTDTATTAEYNFGSAVTQNLALYAKWTAEDSTSIISIVQNMEADGTLDYTDDNDNGIPDCLEELFSIDTDGDGLPDYYEETLGTSKTDVDTDHDGLLDGYEIFDTRTDPLVADSDNNGVSDADEDPDGDKLTNIEEYSYKTNPLGKDTDEDGISDYDEIFVYSTEPINEDTDSDFLNDGDELTYQMDPLVQDTLNDGILDGNRIFEVTKSGLPSDNNILSPSITTTIQGSQIQSLKLDQVEEDVFLDQTVPGYVGCAYDLDIDGNFDSATLSFEIDKEYFDRNNLIPAIYYWDEENQYLEELPNQVINGNTISAQLSHFSKYMVLAKDIYEDTVFEYTISPPVSGELQNKTFDVYLVLDESPSIIANDFAMMKEMCVSLVEDLSKDDSIGVITFHSNIRTICDLSNKETATNAIKGIRQSGSGTAFYDAVYTAISKLSSSSSEGSNIVISLTDGYDNSSRKSASNVASYAKTNNVIVYTIGIGTDISVSDLRSVAEATGGQYYSAANFDALAGVFDRVIVDADLYKDSDNDGISDYHEKAIANGSMKTGTGAPLFNFSSLNYLNDDSDGDGLEDGEELTISSRVINGKETYYVCMISNPCVVDTDGDDLDDFLEDYAGFNPLVSETSTISSSGQRYSLPRNSPSDWGKLILSHAYNYIHNAVENEIREKTLRLPNGLYPKEYSLRKPFGKPARIDLYRPSTGDIWDVKPASYQFPPNKRRGERQLERYIELGKIQVTPLELRKGDGFILDGHLTTSDGYEVDYQNDRNGLIVYYFESPEKRSPEEYIREYIEENLKNLKHYLQFVNVNIVIFKILWTAARESNYNPSTFGSGLLQGTKPYVSNEAFEQLEKIIAGAATGIGIGVIAEIIIEVAPWLLPLAL